MTEFNDKFTPDATAEVDAESAYASTGTANVGTGVEQAQGATGALQTGFSETGHAQMSDVNVQELQSVSSGILTVAAATSNALVTISAATLKQVLDSVQSTRAQNAALVDNIVNTNAAHLNNLVNSASHRHSEIAADRQWNVNETDAYATVLAAKVASILTP